MDSDNSGIENPIFDLAKNQPDLNNDFNMYENILLNNNLVMNSIKPLMQNKKYSVDVINKMLITLNEFRNNIQRVMDTTNNMLQAINKCEDKINLKFSFNGQILIVDCKSVDKLSAILEKIKTRINDFKIEEHVYIFNAKKLELNTSVKDLGLVNNSHIVII